MAVAGSVLRAWASGLALGLWAGAALAGDSAQFNALGYSPDARHFAFEQFGIQDGSGFPYADIFVVDLETDRFVSGAPFRARLDDETAELGDVRMQALTLASGALIEHRIGLPAIALALRGDGALDNDGLAISFGIPGYGLAETRDPQTLGLDIFKAPSGQDCELFEGDPMGFALFRENDGERSEIYRDTRVPASRNCVVTYKFYGVFTPFNAQDDAGAVAILSIWSHGFEGPDRRFLAVPVGRAE